jgi:hypothetical protein
MQAPPTQLEPPQEYEQVPQLLELLDRSTHVPSQLTSGEGQLPMEDRLVVPVDPVEPFALEVPVDVVVEPPVPEPLLLDVPMLEAAPSLVEDPVLNVASPHDSTRGAKTVTEAAKERVRTVTSFTTVCGSPASSQARAPASVPTNGDGAGGGGAGRVRADGKTIGGAWQARGVGSAAMMGQDDARFVPYAGAFVTALIAGCGGHSIASSPDAGGPSPDARVLEAGTARHDAPPVSLDGGSEMDAGPLKPPGCSEVSLSVALQSSQMMNPEEYASQPDVISTAAVDGSTGNAQHENQLVFYLDSANAVGSYAVTAFPNYFYGKANGGEINAGYVMSGPADAGQGAFSSRYVAVSGAVQVTSVLTPHQTEGTLSNVRFNEATEASDGSVVPVPNGSCLWLREASWNTKRAGGCVPFTGTCPGSEYCMPTNAIGDDGTCVTTGTKALGEGCTLVSSPAWDSDCAAGLRCAEFTADLGETSYSCHEICDVRSASDGCPENTHCGGGYDVCLPVPFLLASPQNGNEIDTVATVGEPCAQNPSAIYCGASGLPGTCFTDMGATSAMCRPWQHAASACTSMGESAGYVAYKGGIDESTLFCFK